MPTPKQTPNSPKFTPKAPIKRSNPTPKKPMKAAPRGR